MGNGRRSRIRVFIFLNKSTACVTEVADREQFSSYRKPFYFSYSYVFHSTIVSESFSTAVAVWSRLGGISLFNILILYSREE